jgi:hypothetical protein
MTSPPDSNATAPVSNARPSNPEVENENQRSPAHEGEAPRPATEPEGAKDSSQSPKTRTDPGSGEST